MCLVCLPLGIKSTVDSEIQYNKPVHSFAFCTRYNYYSTCLVRLIPPVQNQPPPGAMSCPPACKPGGYSDEELSDQFMNEFSSDSSSTSTRGHTPLSGNHAHFKNKSGTISHSDRNTISYAPKHKSYACATSKRQPTSSFCYRPNHDLFSNNTK